MTVRSKFRVQYVVEYETPDPEQPNKYLIGLSPVVRNPDGTEAVKATKGGKIELSVVADAAGERYKVGQELYMNFTLVEDEINETKENDATQ